MGLIRFFGVLYMAEGQAYRRSVGEEQSPQVGLIIISKLLFFFKHHIFYQKFTLRGFREAVWICVVRDFYLTDHQRGHHQRQRTPDPAFGQSVPRIHPCVITYQTR